MIQAVVLGATVIVCLGVIVSLVRRERAVRACTSTFSGESSSYPTCSKRVNSNDGLRQRILLTDECVICMEEAPQVEIYPCKHRIMCEVCIVKLMQQEKRVCPLCRINIKGFMPM